MSDTDSFIDEVTEEVRRDRLFLMLKRYGWIGVVAVFAIVGGAAFKEYRDSQERAAAEAAGDALSAALTENEAAARAEGLAQVTPETAGAQAVVALARAGALVEAGNAAEAASVLDQLSLNLDVPQVYRDIAAFKSVLVQDELLAADERRSRLEALAAPGGSMQFLAAEQLALLDLSEGKTEEALARLKEIAGSEGVSRDLQERVSQVIVALGGDQDAAAQDG